jgi:hypothetical protein
MVPTTAVFRDPSANLGFPPVFVPTSGANLGATVTPLVPTVAQINLNPVAPNLFPIVNKFWLRLGGMIIIRYIPLIPKAPEK